MYDFVDDTPTKIQPIDNAGGSGVDVVEAVADLTGADLIPAVEEVRRTGEFSMDLQGASDPDALYRAAGGEQAAGGQARFGCPCCKRAVGRVIRVRATSESAWTAVCAMCAAATLDQYPDASIGGLVRAGRRRRRKEMRDAG